MIFLACSRASAQDNTLTVYLYDSGTSSSHDDCDTVQIDDIIVDYREVTEQEIPEVDSGLDIEYRHAAQEAFKKGYRVYVPGRPRFGNVTFRAAPGTGMSEEIRAWWQQARDSGCSYQKNGSIAYVSVLPAPLNRVYNLYGLGPIAFTPAVVAADGTMESPDELVCSVEDISAEYSGGPTPSNNPTLQVEFRGKDNSTERTYLEGAWRGGELNLVTGGALNGARFHTQSQGHKSIDEVILRGPRLLESMVGLDYYSGQNGRVPVSLIIRELSGQGITLNTGKDYVYLDCFPVGYSFPGMSASDTTGNVEEEVRIKPLRSELS